MSSKMLDVHTYKYPYSLLWMSLRPQWAVDIRVNRDNTELSAVVT